jgi:hypothetical protein
MAQGPEPMIEQQYNSIYFQRMEAVQFSPIFCHSQKPQIKGRSTLKNKMR